MEPEYQKEFLNRAAARAGSFYRLCQLAALDESNVSKMKNGKRNLTLAQMVTICEIVGIDPWQEIPPWCVANAPQLAKTIGGVRRLEHLLEQARQNDAPK